MAKIECSNRLRVILAEKEITNRWLAEQMGVTDMTVSRWKTNKVQPSMAQFVEIAQRDGDGWYLLYVNGKLKAQSASLDYILREFDQYR